MLFHRFAMPFFIAGLALSCSGSRDSRRPAPPLVIEHPDPTGPAASIAPPAEGSMPLRAWPRPSGALLAIEGVAQLSVHDTQLCVLALDGAVWCLRTEGIVTNGVFAPEVITRNLLHVSLSQPVREVVAGSTHACAIGTDDAAWCWGTNDQGELGDGSTDAHPEPVRVAGLEEVAQIAAGERFTCARTLDERVWCWGRNATGQLGDGSRTMRTRPARVIELPPAADIATGRQHSCARTQDGRVFCWGDNAHHQLGCTSYSDPACNDPALNEVRPVRVPDVDRGSQLALGDMHSCVRRFDDSVACWGERANGAGQVGYGRDQWPEAWFATQVAASPMGSCATMDSQEVRCWGDFAFDPFDRGEHGRRSYVLPELRGATNIAIGDRITCVRFGDASARCWLR